MTTLATMAGPVIDLGDIPWTSVTIGLGIAWVLLEARIVKAGFVRQKALDTVSGRVDGCVTMKDFDGLSARFDARIKAADNERDSISRQLLMARTDLDNTRDRTTKIEGEQRALVDKLVESVRPLGRIEEKLDRVLEAQARHDAEIEMLKRGHSA